MINCKFFEAFGDRVGLDEFFQVFQFFGFYSFCRIVAGRYGLARYRHLLIEEMLTMMTRRAMMAETVNRSHSCLGR